jgi:hypothetical protein
MPVSEALQLLTAQRTELQGVPAQTESARICRTKDAAHPGISRSPRLSRDHGQSRHDRADDQSVEEAVRRGRRECTWNNSPWTTPKLWEPELCPQIS